MANTDHAIPGVLLGSINDGSVNGPGTLVRDGHIYSTLAGRICTVQTQEGQKCVEVKSHIEQSQLPLVDSRVVARVTKVNARFCKCSILLVDNTMLSEPFHGMIRREDVRATQKDKTFPDVHTIYNRGEMESCEYNSGEMVELYRCFRPGDIIIAKVLSLGDAMSYVLTTAENELGVVIATSEAGHTMLPVSWCEMQCPKTMLKEFRKVAKVQPNFWTLLTTL